MEQLLGRVERETITKGQVRLRVGDAVYELDECVHDARHFVRYRIFSTLVRIWPDLNPARLLPVVDNAFELAVEMYTQRCRLQLSYPELGERYLEGTTTGLKSVSESEGVVSGNVAFVVSPGLVAWGDADGRKFEQKVDLVPSLVFVEAGKQQPWLFERSHTV